jgi:4-amino-4-deoxy-L-arabinose transferase-like glycosyltransferase
MNFSKVESDLTPSDLPGHIPASWLRIVSPVILIAAGLLMASISWLKWPDLLIDFGEQAYLAWQISEGKVIYKDMTYLYGPFSGYLHALIFNLFGPGILTLAIFNMVVAAALASLIYIFIKSSSDQLTATVCSLTFITLFAFGQYTGGGNFNFICAYIYELPHGVALSLLTLYCFSKYVETKSQSVLIAIYFLVGLVFLTKPEVFLAIAIALPAGTAVFFYLQSLDKKSWIRNILICMGSFLAAPLLFYIYLSSHLSFEKALYYIISPWIYVQNPSNLDLPLYQWVLGTDAIGSNLTKLFTYFLIGVAIIVSVTLVNRFLTRINLSKPISISLGLLSAALLYLLIKLFPLLEFLRPLPLIILILVVYYFIQIIREKDSSPTKPLALFSFSLFSLVLLFKIFLNTHVYHYGFALALPATLVCIRWALYEFPKLLPGPVDYYRTAMTTLGLIIIASHIGFGYQVHQFKGYPVGSGQDTLLDYHPELETRAPIVSNTLKYIRQHTEPDTEIAPIPYGNMINYMTRRHNPLRVHTLNPVEAEIFGEDQYLEEIKAASPEYILLLDVDSSRLGARFFGKDYAQNIYHWINNNYTLEKQFGETPFTGAGFGIQILRKNETPAN